MVNIPQQVREAVLQQGGTCAESNADMLSMRQEGGREQQRTLFEKDEIRNRLDVLGFLADCFSQNPNACVQQQGEDFFAQIEAAEEVLRNNE
jgi:hypothetical protein